MPMSIRNAAIVTVICGLAAPAQAADPPPIDPAAGLPGKFREVCTVSSSSPTQLTGADVAAVVGPDLNAGTSTIEKDRGTDAQVWTVAPGVTVEAGVTIARKVRAISISARRAS